MKKETYECDFCKAELGEGRLEINSLAIKRDKKSFMMATLDFCGTGCMQAFVDQRLKA